MDTTTEMRHTRTIRLEDDKLLRGRGRYMADAPIEGQAYAVFVRSPHAFADIKGIDTEEASQVEGVVAIITGADIAEAGVGNLSQHPPMVGRDGKKLVMPVRPALAIDTVRHAGEAVAMVIAETAAAATDAAELVMVDYEMRDAVVELREAIKPDAPQIWPDAPRNIALDWPGLAPDPQANQKEVDGIFAKAKHVAKVSLVHQRLIVATMEPRGGTATYDPETDSYLLRVCTQGARAMRDGIAQIMNLPNAKLRVTTEEVGGAFGLKTAPYPEYVALLVGARKVGRPVHWMSSRSEAFLTDNQARDAFSEVELALDERGKFLALRLHHVGALGAYVGAIGANIHTANMAKCLPGMYDISKMHVTAECVFTNTTPTAPYRGAGRPEASYCLERVVDEAARITGIDPIKLRKRNLISPKQMPYQTPVGTTYDSGDFEGLVDKALKLADYDGFKQRRKEARSKKLLRGIGVCFVLEHSGGSPTEAVEMKFPGGERMDLNINVQSTGQSHATIFPRVAAEQFGISPDKIVHAHGDSSMEIAGYASVGSRSAMTVGHSMVKAAEVVIAKGKKVAAVALEAAEEDIGYQNGRFEVVGTDRGLSLFEVAEKAVELKDKGEIEETLDSKVSTDTPLTFPNGCHIAEVEIDPQTGQLALVSYTAVDDCGNVLDPTIVEGQTHGAVTMGIGQALLENTVYDSSGQLVSGSFMDYAMPRAHHLPFFKEGFHIVPATTNPLGVKGAGEAGTTAAIAAVMNAVSNAMPKSQLARTMDMPATIEKLWRAGQEELAG